MPYWVLLACLFLGPTAQAQTLDWKGLPPKPPLAENKEQTQLLAQAFEVLLKTETGAPIAKALKAKIATGELKLGFAADGGGYRQGTLTLGEWFTKKSPPLVAVALAVWGTQLLQSGVPPNTAEGLYMRHINGYRVAIELGLKPEDIGATFGKDLMDWIDDAEAEKRRYLRTSTYPSLLGDAKKLRLSGADLEKVKELYGQWEKQTQAWRTKSKERMAAWRGTMEQWIKQQR